MRFIAFVILCIVFGQVISEKNNETPSGAMAETYCHPRFGYCFTYDANIFSKIPAGIEADGMIISNKAGTALFENYGSFNPDNRTIAELRDENLKYLLRDDHLHPKIIKERHNESSYFVTIERDDAYLQQELVLEQGYFKVLTVKADRSNKKYAEYILASTHFLPNAQIAAH